MDPERIREVVVGQYLDWESNFNYFYILPAIKIDLLMDIQQSLYHSHSFSEKMLPLGWAVMKCF